MSDPKVTPSQLRRSAVVYVRQSTLAQVERNRESTARQYDLVARAERLGWPRSAVRVIDDDLGVSGSSTTGRSGFAELAAQVGLGQVGIVLALEVSRLARNAPHQLPIPLTAGGAGSVAFSPDGRTLATTALATTATASSGNVPAAGRQALLLWDLSDPNQPRQLIPSEIRGIRDGPVVFSADDTTLAAVDSTGAVVAWDLTELLALRDDPKAAVCAVVGRGLDRLEWARYVGDAAFVDTCAA